MKLFNFIITALVLNMVNGFSGPVNNLRGDNNIIANSNGDNNVIANSVADIDGIFCNNMGESSDNPNPNTASTFWNMENVNTASTFWNICLSCDVTSSMTNLYCRKDIIIDTSTEEYMCSYNIAGDEDIICEETTCPSTYDDIELFAPICYIYMNGMTYYKYTNFQ
jgi:hypothetical protein